VQTLDESEARMASYPIADPEFWDKLNDPSEARRATNAAAVGMRYAAYHMGEDGDPTAPAAAVLELPPHGRLPRHAHTCWRFEMMVKGSMTGPDGRQVLPGDVRVSRPGEFYGPYVAGPDGSLSVEVFSSAERDMILPEGEEDPIASILRQGGSTSP
jgi:hypothetical protein